MRSALLALLSLFAPGLSSADDSLSPKVLDRVKQATVFIHVEAGARSGTGSAFLIQTEDGSELIVTNEHVVNPKAILERIVRPPAITRRVRPPVAPNHGRPVIPTPGRPVVPAPGRPRNQPGLPPGFQIPNQQPPLTLTYQPPAQVVTSLVTAKKVSVKVVFFSGTKREKTVRAELVGTDDLKDLALIKVEKFAESPAPLEMGGESELIETMPVYIFGFPFGELLSGN